MDEFSDEKAKEVLTLNDKGHNREHIARVTGLTERTVRAILNKRWDLVQKKSPAAITQRQREIVLMALSLLDTPEVTEAELSDTLKAFTLDPNTPAPRVEHIPLLLNMGEKTPIGSGTIVGDTLFIQVNNALLVDAVTRLATVGDIRELYLGLGFPVSPTLERVRAAEANLLRKTDQLDRAKELQTAGRSNAEIANVLGIAESAVRTILESS